ncbi:LytR family transcriptional regulator [Paenibacillus sp. GCM10023248]|uniref:LytR family transcriptional regulator n=1 Tax=unclassified Paenibacillus TaxID=185978 RepID=UPI002378DE68|nr:LytR family transcriptional regulator [Paenibacillus sp. MAHUQ-63]MDD9266221.1 LytR family transcriptional regulator [Paenibacillus sp. MAHUQ-63]
MKKFNNYPKSFKKTIRYINQDDITIELLDSMQVLLNYYIDDRKKKLLNNSVGNVVQRQ